MRISRFISRQAQYKIELALLFPIILFCRLMPLWLVLKGGEGLGWLARKLNMRVATVRTNLQLAMPGRFTGEAMEQAVRQCYAHFGRETFRIFKMESYARTPLEKWADVEGAELIHQRHRAGQGVVLVGGHLGSWELIYVALPKLGIPVSIFSGLHSNQKADKWLNAMRRKSGVFTVGTDEDREMLVEAAQKGVLGIAGDQKPHKAPIYVQFFGRRSAAAQGPAALAQVAGADLLYAGCWMEGGRAKIVFRRLDYTPTESRRKNIQLQMEAFFKMLEADVAAHPEQYLWMHKRWKDDPEVVYHDTDVIIGGKKKS